MKWIWLYITKPIRSVITSKYTGKCKCINYDIIVKLKTFESKQFCMIWLLWIQKRKDTADRTLFYTAKTKLVLIFFSHKRISTTSDHSFKKKTKNLTRSTVNGNIAIYSDRIRNVTFIAFFLTTVWMVIFKNYNFCRIAFFIALSFSFTR